MSAEKTPKNCHAPVKVVLVDDHTSVREMLKVVLKLEGEYEVVGEAGSGTEAMKLCRIARPQIVIMDLSLPELSGTHLVRLLMRESWDVRVVVYSGTSDQRLTREALAEMPHGFVRKEDSLPELRTALRAVVSGARHLSPWASRLMPPKGDSAVSNLSAPERAVLHMIARGLHTRQIAAALCATEKTVEHHRQHLREKLGLHDVASLTRYAIEVGMVQV